MLSRACILYGWTTETCLAMPATRFFAMLSAGSKLDWQRRNWFLSELCDVAGCALGDTKYYKALKAVYYARAMDKTPEQVEQEKTTRPVMNAADPKTGATLTSIFNAVMR